MNPRMELWFFAGINSRGDYQEGSFCGPELEPFFDALTVLVNNGWQLIWVKHKPDPGSEIWLPVDAFDGHLMHESLRMLRQQWEEILH